MIAGKSYISTTFSKVRDFSYQEKKDYLDEESINKFLDTILDFKEYLRYRTDKLDTLNIELEKISWINEELDEECLKELNDLISLSKDLHSTLIRHYVSFNPLRQKGIAKNEIKNFKNAVDVLKESYEDLESIFFYLPEMPDFIETTKELSLI